MIVTGLKLGRKLLRARAFDEYRGEEHTPGSAVQSDADLADHARATAQTIYRPTGTCKMGNDESAVVDARLRVHGIKGLRVVDASIMPRIVNANTNAPTSASCTRPIPMPARTAAKWADRCRCESRSLPGSEDTFAGRGGPRVLLRVEGAVVMLAATW